MPEGGAGVVIPGSVVPARYGSVTAMGGNGGAARRADSGQGGAVCASSVAVHSTPSVNCLLSFIHHYIPNPTLHAHPHAQPRQLISACYPPSSALLTAGPDYSPNSQELSRLTYYAANRPGKISKLGNELEKRVKAESRKAAAGNTRARAYVLHPFSLLGIS